MTAGKETVRRCDFFLLHGIEEKIDEKKYYTDFVSRIRKRLPVDQDVQFHPVNWNRLLEEKENTLYSWMGGLSYAGIRHFACTAIGDALAYAPSERGPVEGEFYYELNKLLEDAVDTVNLAFPGSIKVILGHSQGSQIALSFCFRRPFDTIITMGSPILYYSLRFKDFGEYPPVRQFYNFYSRFDPVATIIGRNPKFRDAIDIAVNSWNPKNCLPIRSHLSYWSSDFVINKIADILIKLSITDDKK